MPVPWAGGGSRSAPGGHRGEGAQLFQQADAVRDVALLRRVDEREVGHLAEVERGHPQDDGREVGPQDLRIGELGPRAEVFLAVEANADSVGGTPAPALALIGRRLRDGLDRQPLHLGPVAVPGDPRRARVDHVLDAGHGQRGLRDVGGQDHTPPAVRLEHAVLLGHRQPGIQRQDLQAARAIRRPHAIFQGIGGVPDLPLTAEEDQDVAGPGGAQLVHGVADGPGLIAGLLVGAVRVGDRPVPHLDRIGPPGHLDHRRTVLARGYDLPEPQCWPGGRPPGIPPLRLAPRRGTSPGHRPLAGPEARTRCACPGGRPPGIPPLRFAPRRGTSPGHRPLAGPEARTRWAGMTACPYVAGFGFLEMLTETLGVDGGGGDDDFEVGAARQQALQVAQDEVDVEAALVRLVDDQRVVAQQPPVPLHLGQQDAVGHQLDQRLVAGVVVEPHLVADGGAELGVQFLRDPRGHGPRGDPARLGVTDLAGDPAAELEADFRQLGRLPRAGLARDDDDLVAANGRRDLVFLLADRQLRRIGDHRHGLAPRCHPRGGPIQFRKNLPERPLPRRGVAQGGRPVGTPAQPELIALRQLRQACPHVGERSGHGGGLHRAGTGSRMAEKP